MLKINHMFGIVLHQFFSIYNYDQTRLYKPVCTCWDVLWLLNQSHPSTTLLHLLCCSVERTEAHDLFSKSLMPWPVSQEWEPVFVPVVLTLQ